MQSLKPINNITLYLFAVLIGIISGLGAILFRALIALFHNLFFYGQFNLNYDANIHAAPSVWDIGIILVPVLGGLLVTWIVKNFAPEARGHGVPEVIDAIYFKEGKIRPIIAVCKSLASALSIGTGGSVGREGPIVQIGSAFGSALGQLKNIPVRQRIILIAAGAAAGIGATFNAPIGGIVFAIELLLVSINATTIGVVGIATIIATTIGRYFFGMYSAFNIPALTFPIYEHSYWSQIIFFLPLGFVIGLLSIAFTQLLYWTEDRFDGAIKNEYLRHAFGMLLMGMLMYGFMHFSGHYYVQGVGYATIYDSLQQILLNPWFLLLLCVGKLIATCLTLGSGGSGGVFSPSLFLGATFGTAFGSICVMLFPQLGLHPLAFTLAAMAAMVAGTTGAIITAIIMIFEMTRDYNMMIPIIVAAVAAHVTRASLTRENIYTLKLLRRGRPIHEGQQAAVLSGYRAIDIMSAQHEHSLISQPYVRCTADSQLIRILQLMREQQTEVALVFNDANEVVGQITQKELNKITVNVAHLLV